METLRPSTSEAPKQAINPAPSPAASTTATGPVATPAKPITFDTDKLKEDTSKVTVNLWGSEHSDTNFVKQPTNPAKPDVDNLNTQFINSNPWQNMGPGSNPSPSYNPAMGGSGRSKESLLKGIRALLLLIDYIFANAMAKMAMEKNPQPYMLLSPEKRMIEENFSELLEERGGHIPIWVVCLLSVLGTFGLTFWAAMQQRKAKMDANGGVMPNTAKPSYTPPNNNRPTPHSAPHPNENPVIHKPVAQAPHPAHETADTSHFANIHPPVTPPKPAPPQMEQSFVVGKDGTATPIHDTHIARPASNVGGYTHRNPDPKLTAESNDHWRDMVRDGIYPMWRKSVSSGAVLKCHYNDDGSPRLVGKKSKILSRRK